MTFIILMLIFESNLIFSQDQNNLDLISKIENSYNTNEPVWLLMERGKQAFNLGEYGLASRVFREVLNRGNNPDAEIWLAYIFEQEGEYDLAEKQYIKALEGKSGFYILDDEITVLYKLAEIYRKTDQYRKYESTLLQIIEKDEREGKLNLQYSMLNTLKEQGIDKMFELYRYENTKYSRAQAELGVFYYQTGRYTESEINLILPIVSIATTGFKHLYDKTAVYEYYNFDLHINNLLQDEMTKNFLYQNNFFKTAYYLAASLYADGYIDSAESIWEIVNKYAENGSTWKIRAGRQLRSPFIEPIITHRT